MLLTRSANKKESKMFRFETSRRSDPKENFEGDFSRVENESYWEPLQGFRNVCRKI